MEQDRFTDGSAQLWCLPQHAQKEMDVDFAFSIAAWGRKLYAEGLAEGEAKLAKAEANNTADPALKPGPACGGCGLDDCRFCD